MPTIGIADSFPLLTRINLNHLMYFWAVGSTGSFTAAARRMGVSQPSVSEQVRTLESRLGTRLLDRQPRGVRLTPAGRAAMRYAEEVVGVCSEMVRSLPLRGEPDRVRPLVIGAADAVPKLVVTDLLRRAAVSGPDACGVVCREWRIDHLLAELSMHRLDLVINDSVPDRAEGSSLRSFIGHSSPVSLYATPQLARRLRRGFPRSLHGAPMLLPAVTSTLRGNIDRWLALNNLRPRVLVEADDRALLHHFAEAGEGVVPVAVSKQRDIARQFGLTQVGRMRDVHEEYFMLMLEREREEHPALQRLRASLGNSRSIKPRSAAIRSRSQPDPS